jgi:hypothetical protein
LQVVEVIGSGSRQCRAFRTSNQGIIPQIRIARLFHLWVLRHDRHSPPAFRAESVAVVKVAFATSSRGTLLAICLSAVEQDGSSISKCNRPVLALGVDTLTALFSGRFGDVR